MESGKFGEFCSYISKGTEKDLVKAAFLQELLVYGVSGEGESYETMKQMLNDFSLSRYSVRDGDRIEAEISDIIKNISAYEEIYNDFLSDKQSKETFLNLLWYRLRRNIRYINLALAHERQYFEKAVQQYVRADEGVYADCGALDGMTIFEYIIHHPDYLGVYGYEPMEEGFQECLKNVDNISLKNVWLHKAAVSDQSKTLYFDSNVRGSSRKDEEGDIIVDATSLDEDIREKICFLKMDIEGSEKEAILGAQKHIKNDSPVLAICVYHLYDDLRVIPQMIKEINPNYRFLIRHYTESINETVLYGIPKNSSKKESCNNYSQLQLEIQRRCFQMLYYAQQNEKVEIYDISAYLSQQLEEYRKEAISSREDFTKLEEGKAYLQGEVTKRDQIIDEQNKIHAEEKAYFQDEVTKRDQIIDGQNKKYAEEKDYFQDEVTKRDRIIDEQNKIYAEGKDYLQNEVAKRDQIISEQNKVVEELRQWSQKQSGSISELQEWVSQLEDAKDFFVKEIEEAKKNIEHKSEENKKLIALSCELENKNKKLSYYLKQEIDKPWYKKLRKNNGFEVDD